MDEFTRFEGAKSAQYQHLMAQAEAVLKAESHWLPNAANLCAMLKAQFDWLWVGFYWVDEPSQSLVLGPFQGPLACTRIPYNKGVCGRAWAEGRSFIVPNVHEFEGHIACSSLSNSEIVLPCRDANGKIKAVLDIDSRDYNSFDETDAQYLAGLLALIQW